MQQLTVSFEYLTGDFTIRRRDGKENFKNQNRFSRQNNNFTRASHFFYTILYRLCTTTTWNCLILLFREEVNRPRRNFILFPNLNMVLRNSAPGGFAYTWQTTWVGIIAIKIERTQIHFWSDVFAAFAWSYRNFPTVVVYLATSLSHVTRACTWPFYTKHTTSPGNRQLKWTLLIGPSKCPLGSSTATDTQSASLSAFWYASM